MLIGVAGYARSGKDEVGRALARRGFAVTRFSQALKDEVVARFPRTLDAISDLHGQSNPSDRVTYHRWLVEVAKPRGVRELLQEYGSEVRRADDPEYWTKRWADIYHELADAGRDVCTVDVRFQNEADVVRRHGGVIWRVIRPSVGPQSGHQSEVQDFDVDVYVHNYGSLEDLNLEVGSALELYRR